MIPLRCREAGLRRAYRRLAQGAGAGTLPLRLMAPIVENPRAMTASQSSQVQKASRQFRRCRTSDLACQTRYPGERAGNAASSSPFVSTLLSLRTRITLPT